MEKMKRLEGMENIPEERKEVPRRRVYELGLEGKRVEVKGS